MLSTGQWLISPLKLGVLALTVAKIWRSILTPGFVISGTGWRESMFGFVVKFGVCLVLLLGVSEVGASQNAIAQSSGEATVTYPLEGGEVFPEGIAYQEDTGDFFVSSTTDGAIYQGNVAVDTTGFFLEPGADNRTTAVGMAVDGRGHLFVSGGDTGQAFVYDTADGSLIESFSNGEDMTFINDVTVTPDGSAYFTDSMNPELYRATPTADGGYEFESVLNFEDTPVEYGEGFNLNGIASSPDGRYLVTVQSSTGNLYRIDTATSEVIQIDTGGADLTNGDGILLDGHTLYVVRNEQETIVPVQLSADYSSGDAGEAFTEDAFMYPTTIASYDGRLLAVNSQFGAQESGDPELPFNVSNTPIPAQAGGATGGENLPETGGTPLTLPALGVALAGFALAGAMLTIRRFKSA
jgi:Cu-Zn family superoxide dismutase